MLRAEVWLTTTLIAVGIIGGLIYNWPSSNNTPQNDTAQTASKPSNEESVEGLPAIPFSDFGFSSDADEPPAASIGADHIETGDNFLLVGNYPNAYRAYIRATSRKNGNNSSLLLFKLGLCSEMSGLFAQAEGFYHKAIHAAGNRQNDLILAYCGLARIWQLLNRFEESEELSAELFLRFATDESIPEEIRMQVIYQLSTISQRQFLNLRPTQYSDVHQTKFHWCKPIPQFMISLDDGASDIAPSTPTSVKTTQIEVIQRPSEDINLISIDARTPLVPISELINEISRQAELQIELTPKAESAIIGRSAELKLTGIPLSLALDNLVAPHGLMWDQIGDKVNIRHLSDVPAQVVSYRFQQANRILRFIKLSFPRNERKYASLLHLGNLSVMVDDYDGAGTRYQELAKAEPNGEISAKLSFNLAKLDLCIGRFDKAVGRLMHSVDQTMDNELQAASYGWLGKIELGKGNNSEAIYATSRGVSLGTDPAVRQSNLMTLAKAYLLESKPFAANKVLFDNSESIVDEKSKRLAIVFGAYARFLGTTESSGLRNEAERMIIALANLQPGDPIDFVDELLVGRAYFEVGFSEYSAKHMQLALEHASQEIWHRRIAYELGMHQFRSGETEMAAKIFSEIIHNLDDKPGLLAQLKLAEISLLQKQPDRCLVLCQQLWKMPLDEDHKTRTLAMMGQAYRSLGRPHAAAVCFSGMVPHDSTNQAVSTDSNSSTKATGFVEGKQSN